VLHRPNSRQLPNTLPKNYSSRLCFHPSQHNHDRKDAFMCHSVPVFLRVCFNPRPYAMSYSDATKRAASQTLACTLTCIFRVENPFNAYVNYEHTLSRSIHHNSIVSLLQEKVALCSDLPKQNTFRL
jgi:hypothetical protein